MASDFVVEELAEEGRLLVVTGPWSAEAADAVASGVVDGLELNYARGYQEPDLSFLRPWPLRYLLVLDRSLTDLAPVSRLGATLVSLNVEAGPGVRADLSRLPRLRRLFACWDAVKDSFHSPALDTAALMEYDEPSLRPLAVQPSLRRLVLRVAPVLESLDGVDDISTLESLRVTEARELVDISAVSAARRSLTEFELQYCLGIESLDDVATLEQLRLLGVNACGRIHSIRPLAGLLKLRVFLAWESTRIMDNDLSPLLGLPQLAELRMRDRREYRPRVKEIKARLAGRT